LLITFGFVSVFTFSKASQEWVQKNPALFWIALVSSYNLLHKIFYLY